MNVPEVYLVEPYNAYAPKGRKKHWHEVVEEQALLARILAEQQALQEASNRTLPPNSPDVSSPTVGNMAGGAGGTPVWDFWNPASDVVSFSESPSSGDAPVTVTFTNLTTTPQFDSYRWFFTSGSGTLVASSTDVNPVIVFQSGSTNPVVITASLQTTNSVSGVPGGKSSDVYITVGVPQVTPSFTVTTSSNVAPFLASFTNSSVNTSQTPSTTYLWTFTYRNAAGASTVTSSSLQSPASILVQSGSFTASLQATGSYNIAAVSSSQYVAAAPTLTAAFTFTTSSNSAPSTTTFVNTTVYNGSGTQQVTWSYGSASLTSNTSTPPPLSYTVAGPYTASLQVTESIYNINSYTTRSWRLE